MEHRSKKDEDRRNARRFHGAGATNERSFSKTTRQGKQDSQIKKPISLRRVRRCRIVATVTNVPFVVWKDLRIYSSQRKNKARGGGSVIGNCENPKVWTAARIVGEETIRKVQSRKVV